MADYSKEFAIINEALTAAQNATNSFLNKYGDSDCCGFAWVKVYDRRFGNALKACKVGENAWDKGVDVWNPSGCGTQAMTAKEEGARAFAEVLRTYGVEAYAQSRMD